MYKNQGERAVAAHKKGGPMIDGRGRGHSDDGALEGWRNPGTRRARAWSIAVAALAAMVLGIAWGAPALKISLLGYQIQSIERVPNQPSPTLNIVSRAGVLNGGDKAFNVTASLASTSPNVASADPEASASATPKVLTNAERSDRVFIEAPSRAVRSVAFWLWGLRDACGAESMHTGCHSTRG
jgi:hypothetical protein